MRSYAKKYAAVVQPPFNQTVSQHTTILLKCTRESTGPIYSRHFAPISRSLFKPNLSHSNGGFVLHCRPVPLSLQQDLKWCWELQEALRCMGIYHAASLRLYEGVVWTCFYITDAGKDTTEEVSLARDLLALAWHTYGSSDQDRRSVLFAVKVKKELEESAERCSGPSDGKSCSDDDREHFSACSLVRSSGRIQSTGITNLFEEGMKVGSQDAAGGGQGMDESS